MSELNTSKMSEKLGIRVLPKVLVAEPNYVLIALKWSEEHDKTGSNDALLAAKHFAKVATELGQAEMLDDPTLEL
jgi:hypothetical protein